MDSVRENYKTDSNLMKRAALHEKYSTNPFGFFNWIMSNYQIKPNSRVLELGAGNGSMWKEHLELVHKCEFVMTNFSEGMIEAAKNQTGEHGQVEFFTKVLQPYGVEDKLNKRFTLQNVEAMLRKQFASVERLDYEDSLAVTDVEDLVTYIRTMTSMTHVKDVPFDVLTNTLKQQMVDGVLRIPKEYGMFQCKKHK